MLASRSALCRGIAIVSHDANHTGAPYIALNVARELKVRRGIPVVTILLHSGPLAPKFGELGPLFIAPARPLSFMSDPRAWARIIKSAIWCWQTLITMIFWNRVRAHLNKKNVLGAVCNSVLSGDAAVQLKIKQIRTIGLIHEMPQSIQVYNWSREVRAMISGADALVFPSPRVQAAFTEAFGGVQKPQLVAPQGANLDSEQLAKPKYLANRAMIRKGLGVTENDIVVLGCGQGGYRKGIDFFFETARHVCLESKKEARKVVFAWVGWITPETRFWLNSDITKLGLSERIQFVGEHTDVAPYFAAADIFFLSSREDPFPTVVLEAMAHGVPVVGFAGSGGLEDQIAGGAGIAVAYGDVAGAVRVLRDLADRPENRAVIGQLARAKVEGLGGFSVYVDKLIGLLSDVPATSAN